MLQFVQYDNSRDRAGLILSIPLILSKTSSVVPLSASLLPSRLAQDSPTWQSNVPSILPTGAIVQAKSGEMPELGACPYCGGGIFVGDAVCGHCKRSLGDGSASQGANAASAAPLSTVVYSPQATAGVVSRLRALAALVMAFFIIEFAISGFFRGLSEGAAATAVLSPPGNAETVSLAIMCGVLGALVGGAIGWLLGSLVTVWLDWGAQMLILSHLAHEYRSEG